MKVVKYHAINDLQGYAVRKIGSEYRISFMDRFLDVDGAPTYKLEGDSYSAGKLHSYASPFVADDVIRKQILPLYKIKAAA